MPFFAHFKLDLCSECRLWRGHGQCVLRDCAVCECEDPPRWAAEGCEGQVDDRVITGASSHIVTGWSKESPPSEEEDATEVVVDLRENPERYTGYGGDSAAKVWGAIHGENCFQPVGDGAGQVCFLPGPQRIYNRLLSGLHSSISTHIAHDYCLEPGALGECARWGPAPEVAYERVLQHSDRLENLYAAYAVLLRAVVKAGDAVSAAVPTDDAAFAPEQREWEDVLLPQVRSLAAACPRSFNETELVLGLDAGNTREELETRFQHLQEIMRCVGCDRCKLWGTLQALGLGTALRVLFPPADGSEGAVVLSRQEAVALVHTLERFSSSLVYLRELSGEA